MLTTVIVRAFDSGPRPSACRVRWSTFNAGKSYKYQAGVQFNPYGMEKNQNVPQVLTKIVALEQKFIEPGSPDVPGKAGEFGV